MSSLRNSLHRRNHKERSQLSHRSRLGILEKHKDYVLRARDYHSKQDRINLLRQKAAVRNKDEFYFGMNKQKTEGGIHVKDRGNIALPVDMVKVLKTQDENYIRTMRTAGLKKIDKLKSHLSALANLIKPTEGEKGDAEKLDDADLLILQEAGVIPAPSLRRKRKSGASQKGKHILFAESPEQARQFASSSGSSLPSNEDMDTSEESPIELGWKLPETKKGKKRQSTSSVDAPAKPAQDSEAATETRTRLLKELSARLVRDKQLRYAERELEMQKLLMTKGGSSKLAGVEKVESEEDSDDDDESRSKAPRKVDEKTWKPRVYKWRAERKR